MTAAVRFIPDTAVFRNALRQHSFSHRDGYLAHTLQQCFISKHLCSFNQQPAAFDVVAIRDALRFHMPLFVQEQVEMLAVCIDNMVQHGFDQLRQLALQLLRFPDPVQAGVAFQNMQMGIHRLLLVHILGTETQVLRHLPFA
ncbi:hypothetical protein D3C73_1333560 [compost metagenome]